MVIVPRRSAFFAAFARLLPRSPQASLNHRRSLGMTLLWAEYSNSETVLII